MKIKKTAAKLTAFLLAVCMLGTTALAYDGVYTDKDGNISYEVAAANMPTVVGEMIALRSGLF